MDYVFMYPLLLDKPLTCIIFRPRWQVHCKFWTLSFSPPILLWTRSENSPSVDSLDNHPKSITSTQPDGYHPRFSASGAYPPTKGGLDKSDKSSVDSLDTSPKFILIRAEWRKYQASERCNVTKRLMNYGFLTSKCTVPSISLMTPLPFSSHSFRLLTA